MKESKKNLCSPCSAPQTWLHPRKEKTRKKTTLGEASRYSSPGLRLPESAWVWSSSSSVSPVHPDEPVSALLFRGCCIEEQLNNLWDVVQTEVTGPLIQRAGSVKIIDTVYYLFLNLSFVQCFTCIPLCTETLVVSKGRPLPATPRGVSAHARHLSH